MKLKRIISLMLAFVMVMSLGIGVSASTELEITYLNADNSAIHIEFSNGIKVSNLSNFLTIMCEGEEVSYSIKETLAGTVGNAVYENGASESDNAAIYDEGTTYTIVPNNGINMGTPYVIMIDAGLVSEDASLSLASGIKKIIKVREIFTEDFSKNYILPPQGMSLIYNDQGGSFSIVDQHLELSAAENTWATFAVHPYVPGDDGNCNYMGNSQTLKMREYIDSYKYGNGADSETTLSVKIKAVAESSGEFELVSSWQTGTPHSFDYQYCPQYTSIKIDNNAKAATITSRYGTTNDLTNPYLGPNSKEQVKYTKTFGDASNNITATGYSEIKISELDGKIKSFIDNKNIINLKNATGEANGLFGIRYKNLNCYIDDVCITKMEELDVKPLEYMGIETSPDGIIAEFSGMLDTDVLRGAITFTENGETLSVYELTNISAEGKYRYLINPVGGITLDIPYTLEIASGIESMDGLTTPLQNSVYESFTITLPEIKLSYFDADATAINLELSQAVDFNQLNNSITLKREGVGLEYDLYDASVTPTQNVGAMQTTTYQIVPKEGMKLGVTYYLEIKKGIMSPDGESAVMKKDIVKNFKIEKLIFEGFDYQTTKEFRGVWLSANDKDEIENGALKYTMSGTGQAYILVHPYGRNIMAGSDFTGEYFSRTFMQTQGNYTVQADIKMGNDIASGAAGVLALHKGIPEGDSSEYNSFTYRIRYGVVHDIINNQGGIQSQMRTWSRPYVDDKWDPDHDPVTNPVEPDVVTKNGYINSASEGLSTEEYKTIRLSTRNGYFKGYLGYLNTSSYFDELLRNATGGVGFIFTGGQARQSYYIDNMYVTRMVEVLPVTSSIPTGTTEVELKPSFVISTNKAIEKTSVSTSTVKVKTDSGYIPTANYTVTGSDEGDVTVSFKRNLDSKTTYYVELDGIVLSGEEKATPFETISFKTRSLDFEIDSFKVTNSLGGEGFAPGDVTINAKIKNNYIDAPQSFVMSICIYNEKNQLVGVKAQKYTVAKGEEAANSLTITLGDGSYKAKCFVWSGFELMTESIEEKIIE